MSKRQRMIARRLAYVRPHDFRGRFLPAPTYDDMPLEIRMEQKLDLIIYNMVKIQSRLDAIAKTLELKW